MKIRQQSKRIASMLLLTVLVSMFTFTSVFTNAGQISDVQTATQAVDSFQSDTLAITTTTPVPTETPQPAPTIKPEPMPVQNVATQSTTSQTVTDITYSEPTSTPTVVVTPVSTQTPSETPIPISSKTVVDDVYNKSLVSQKFVAQPQTMSATQYTYVYDSNNRLTQILKNDIPIVIFNYDDNGSLISKQLLN